MKLLTNVCIASILMTGQVIHGQTPTFLSNFEDQNTDAEIGEELTETYEGDYMSVVANPHPDAFNSSNYVLKLSTNEGLRNRAEYDVWRNETVEKTYIYAWKRYHPAGMFKDVNWAYGVINQWKTWPCEVYGSGSYANFSTLISYYDNGGIFNETRMDDTAQCFYLSRAEPCRRAEAYTIPEGYWNQFVLEIYWTNTENGYYRLWRNDTLIGYTDHIKTLMDGFIEGTCDMYWSTGLYNSWSATGSKSQSEVIAYIDDITMYDEDDGYTVKGLFPNCPSAPATPTGSNVYKVNVYGQFSSDGYNNYVLHWNRSSSMYNLSNTWGQSSDIDIFFPTGLESNESRTSIDGCFPGDVINSWINTSYGDKTTRSIKLEGLNPSKTYTFKMLSVGGWSSSDGTQIWTTEANRDTVFSYHNTCDMAELTNLKSDENGDLTINFAAIGLFAYVNAIEIVEYIGDSPGESKNPDIELFPNPVKDVLFINVGSIPESVTIYTYDGKKVKSWGNVTEIDVSALPKGIYIASIKIEASTISGIFIKV